MATPAHRLPQPTAWPRDRDGALRRLWPAAVLGLAALLGLVTGVEPLLALAAVVAAAFVPLVLTRPLVGLYALTFLSFLESYSGALGAFSLTKLAGLLLVVAWIAAVATASPADRAAGSLLAREPVLAVALVLFVAWSAISLVWAAAPGVATDSVTRFALNFVLFPIVLAFVRTPRHAMGLFAVFIAGAIASVGVDLLQGDTDAGRLSGVGLNTNQLGAFLVVSTVLAGALAANGRLPALARLAALVAAVFAVLGVAMTQSRGALFGLAVAALVAPLAAGRGRRAGTLALVVAAATVPVGWYAVVAPESAVQRVTQPTAESGSGREGLWTVGWRMVEDHPFRGVGAGNFPVSSIDYLLQPGRTDRDSYIVDRPKAAHNIYLNVLAELGIVGLTLLVTVFVCSLLAALRAARAFAERGEPELEILARALFVGLVGYMASLFFSTQIYDKQLWLLLAAAPALLAVAERRGRGEDGRRAPVLRLSAVHGRGTG